MTRIDWMAIAPAAVAGLAVLAIGAIASEVVAGRTGGWAVWPLLAVALLGFVTSGLVAGRLRPDTPMIHGGLAGLTTFAVALVVGLVVASLRNRSISVGTIPLTALMALTLGIAGALAADSACRRSGRRRSSRGRSLPVSGPVPTATTPGSVEGAG